MFDRRDRSRSRDREEERGRDGRERGREQYGQSRYGVYAPPPASSSSSKDLATAAASEEDPGYDDAALKEIEQFLEQDGEGEEDEEAKLSRLAEERRRRREAILRRQAPPSQPQAQPQRAASPPPLADAAVEAEKTKLSGGAVFDMFSATADSGPGLLPTGHALEEGEDPLLQSNWDDSEGYYRARAGEVIHGDYVSVGVVGKGVFATVLKCLDRRRAPGGADAGAGTGAGAEQSASVAIKLIRNNDTMRRAADKEKAILLAIAASDPHGRRGCIRLLEHFEHRSHVALVFEFMQGNLRETLKRFGKDVGINVSAVRLYARQLLSALSLLAELRVVHADIKLDNIMCSADLKQVKLCDFGSAFFETASDNAPTPYLVSRFYRAPEIVLGLPYDRAIDMWSVAVSLFELFTGQVLFPGRTNNEMLRLFMAVKGRMPSRLIKHHQRQFDAMRLEAHFDDDGRFKQAEVDALTGLTTIRLIDVPAPPTRDLGPLLRSSKSGADDGRVVGLLADLLDKCLALDPSKRLPVADALKHPFFSLAP